MFSDSDNRIGLKTFRSASLVSTIFDSETSTNKLHHQFDPVADIDIESPDTPRKGGIYDSDHLSSHMGRAVSGRSGDLRKGVGQPKRFDSNSNSNNTIP